MNQTALSPCVGMCSTTYGDLVCRGCYRTTEEILNWPGFNGAEKLAVRQRLNNLIEQVASEWLVVADAALLRSQLQRYSVPFDPLAGDYSLAHLLLRQAARHIRNPQDYGIAARPAYQHLSLTELLIAMDAKLREVAGISGDAAASSR